MDFTLTRTGNSPLSFQGELIAEGGSKWVNGKDRTRWYELAVYRTKGGKWIAHIQYCTRWEGEVSRSVVDYFADESGLRSFLLGYDPTEGVRGFPPGDHYAERQSRLLAELREQWEVAISEVYDELPGEFNEVID